MAKLYADENFNHVVVRELRASGHDVLTCRDVGQSGAGVTDELVLAMAISLERAVLTFDRRDFARLHRNDPNHFGIVACTDDRSARSLAFRSTASLLPIPICGACSSA